MRGRPAAEPDETGHNDRMGPSPRTPAGEQPLVRFKPTTGPYVGAVGLALAGVAAVWAAVSVHTVTGLRIGAGALFFGVLVWLTQLRPRVTAYPSHLLLRGTVRDTEVPYAAIDEVTMGQTLNVWAGGRRYVCIGIGKSLGAEARQRVRSSGQGGLFGSHRMAGFGGAPAAPRAMSYHSFVLARIDELVAGSRSGRGGDDVPPVRHRYAVPELAALLVTGAGFVLALLV